MGDTMMKISKTRFFNYIRCHRYVALEDLAYNRHRAVLSFDESLEDLYTQELEDKKHELLHHLYENMHYSESDFEDDQDFDPLKDDENNTLFRLLQPQYEQIEQMSAEKVHQLFGGMVTFSQDTYRQKYIEKEVDGFYFFAFVDAYQEDDKTVRIVETKASTTKKFIDLGFRKNKMFQSIFSQNELGIYKLRDELKEGEDREQFMNQFNKLLNKYDGIGRYVYDLAYQRYIHEHNYQRSKKKEYYLALLNHEYMYNGERSQDGSLIYHAKDIIRLIDLTDVTRKLIPIIDDEVKQIILRLNQMQASPVPLGIHCQKEKSARECPFIKVCFGDKGVPDKNSLFVYRNIHLPFVENRSSKEPIKYSVYDLINEGTVHALDISYDWLSTIQKMQYDVIESKKPYINKNKIKAGIQSLKYPLYHLDFESFASPLPRYKGEKPYQQSLFQFSLHVEYQDQRPIKDHNFYYLAEDHDDHRERLVKKLVEYIPMNGGHVIVYNKGFESGRIKELIQLFPQYKEPLKDIQRRIFDLLHLVRGNKEFYESLGFGKEKDGLPVYYHEDFQRSFSIKKVLPVFVPALNYNNLEEVHNGQEAQIAYYQMPYLDQDLRARTYFNMLEYCKQDTWAMVEILEYLRNLVQISFN